MRFALVDQAKKDFPAHRLIDLPDLVEHPVWQDMLAVPDLEPAIGMPAPASVSAISSPPPCDGFRLQPTVRIDCQAAVSKTFDQLTPCLLRSPSFHRRSP